ncbi:recQ-mediated genome instability protein 1 [Pholidichthys leucotaenia]
MTPGIQAVVHAAQAWLQSSCHVQVPFAWLEACVQWLQEEAGGAALLSQQQINQQVLDQWLLTDLRDLDFPVLPEGLNQAQKTELRGIFCVQVDSLLDVSQPAYGQLQKWRGTDCSNDEVSVVTQFTQKPWEAKPTRMLMLQVTDGVQSLEAMEYQPIPALGAALRPGAKLQLQGPMVCRLGVLLLGPSNIKILGGEVEDLVDKNNQGRVLCRMLGLPEEQQQEGEDPPAAQQANQEVEDLEFDDAELLASLEAQEDAELSQVEPSRDSGYRTLREITTESSRSSSVSFASAVSSRTINSTLPHRSNLTPNNGSRSGQRQHSGNEQVESDPSDFHASDVVHRGIQDHSMADADFPDEDFDDLPLDELDSVIFQESNTVIMQADSSHRSTTLNIRMEGNPCNLDRETKPNSPQCEPHSSTASQLESRNSKPNIQKRDSQGCDRGSASGELAMTSCKSFPSTTSLEPEKDFFTNNESNFMDEDIDCFLEEAETSEVKTAQAGGQNNSSVQKNSDRENLTSSKQNPNRGGAVPSVTLTSPPFTYLCLLKDMMSKPNIGTIQICVKAFIVTLLGKLSSSNGVWRVCATVSDGSGYLDVELSDEVLRGLLGFSVAEKGALKRDPARRGELEAGMRRCQEELVDMCCIMTIVVEPEGRKAVVTKANPVSEKVLQELEQRVKYGRK